MSEVPFDTDRCRILWAAVFERALRDAQCHIPTQPNWYNRDLYLKRQRKQRSNITPYRRWARARRLKIKKLELRRDEAVEWIERSKDFGVCCELVCADTEGLRERLLEEVAA